MVKKELRPRIIDILLTVLGAFLCGSGCGFMNYASLGMDALGTFYDGLRMLLGLSIDNIGTVSLIVNIVLIIFLFFASRKYLSIGTLIFMAGYSLFANLATMLPEAIFTDPNIYIRATIGITGILILCIGLGIYIAVDIGVDPPTGLILYVTDITHKKMQYVKITLDLIVMVAGILLGARIGAITVISVLISGPLIAYFTKIFQKLYFKRLYTSSGK